MWQDSTHIKKIFFGAYYFNLWNSRQRTTLFKRSNFSFLVGKRKSSATLEACQQPVSSTCMIMVARLVTTALSQKLNISSNSHFPQFLPSHLIIWFIPDISILLCLIQTSALESRAASLGSGAETVPSTGSEGYARANYRNTTECGSLILRQPGVTYRAAGNEDLRCTGKLCGDFHVLVCTLVLEDS